MCIRDRVERVQRTIKERMHRYFTKMNTFKYIDILNDLAYSYNRSYHRTIKTTPLAMSKTRGCRTHLCEKENKIKENSGMKVNDYVRVSRSEARFRKGYEAGWTTEVFKVHNIRAFRRDSCLLYTSDAADERSS